MHTLRAALLLTGSILAANSASALCLLNCDYTKTKYPVVMAPGVLGFDKLAGFADYWYQIPGAMRDGGAKVFTTSASAFNDADLRGEQLLKQTQDILALTGAAKVNLMGHSHGGYSARYVAAALPSRVASMTLIHSPVKGTPVADLVRKVAPPGAFSEDVVQTVGTGFSKLVTYLAGNSYNENFMASMDSLTTQGAAAFNARFPNGVPVTACGEGAYSTNGIRNYSWGGTSSVTNVADPLDLFFGMTGLAGKEANDGLVGRCSSHFGQVLRDNYPWNHGDAINHLFAIRGLFTPAPTDVYRQQANRLKVAGL
jgi:triacylglycerol lipase